MKIMRLNLKRLNYTTIYTFIFSITYYFNSMNYARKKIKYINKIKNDLII